MIHMLQSWIAGHSTPLAAVAAAAPGGQISTVAQRRWLIGTLLAATVATAASLAIYPPSTPFAGQTISHQLGKSAAALGATVASLFDGRSPGARAAGALASLKNRAQPALHERALPKIRRTMLSRQPVAPTVAPPPPVSLYNIVNGPPQASPVTIASSSALPFGLIPGGGGGGGVLVGSPAAAGVIPGTPGTPSVPGAPVTPGSPGTTTVPVVPSSPVAPGVPEPSSWAMMLIGFALVGRSIACQPRTMAVASRSR